MGPDSNISFGTGTIYVDGVEMGNGTVESMEFTEECFDEKDFPIRINESAEFSGTINIPPRAFIKLFGFKWFLRVQLQSFRRRIRGYLFVEKEKNDETKNSEVSSETV